MTNRSILAALLVPALSAPAFAQTGTVIIYQGTQGFIFQGASNFQMTGPFPHNVSFTHDGKWYYFFPSDYTSVQWTADD